MQLRTVFRPDQGTHSVVRINALWRAVVLAALLLSSPLVAANGMCPGSLQWVMNAMDLDACRPAPISAAEKAILLESLPAEGEVTHLTKSERRKLAALDPVLRLHGRKGVYGLKVIALPQAWTGLYERAVLLISLPALRLLDSEELQAVVAHEIGHEYVWQEYAIAQRRNDIARLRELELTCDAIAVLTLMRLGVNPHRLVTAVEKGLRFNQGRFGRPRNENSYPPLMVRRDLVKRMSSAIK